MRLRYTNKLIVQNGRIRRSTPIGLENASVEQRETMDLIKPMMHAWLRSKMSANLQLENADVLVNAKYIETSNGLTVEFKIQSVLVNEQASSS